MEKILTWLKQQPKLWLLISVLSISMASFHLISTQILLFSHWPFLNIHLAFGLVIVFLVAAEDYPKLRVVFIAAALLSFIATAYIQVEADALIDREQMPTSNDFVVGIIMIILVISAAYFAFGFILPLMAILGLIYALYGPYFPGELFHAGVDLKRLVAMLVTDLGGIYGTLLFISAIYMAIFLTLGAFIEKSGTAQFFIDLPLALFRGIRAGGAYAAVAASALLGMGSGSPVANVVTTGTFTIPLMKRSGFRPHEAGGIEAAASTGGQLMPPVMGAVAFVLAQFTGIPYIKVIGYAIIPAILYFLAVGFGVYFRSTQMQLEATPNDQIVEWNILAKGFPNFLPIAVLVGILVAGYTPSLAAFWAVISLTFLILIRHPNWEFFKIIGRCLAAGGRFAAQFATAMACIAILVKVILATGIGLKLPLLIEQYADGNLFKGYILTAAASVILGMGLPTVAAYIVVAVLAVPALVQMGALPLQAHLFVLYFSILSALTPPVALAALAGAKVADADYLKTSWASLRYGFMAFVIPFLFAYNPALIALDSTWAEILLASLATLFGCFAIAAFVQGYFLKNIRIWSRMLLGTSVLFSFWYVVSGHALYFLLGLAFLSIAVIRQSEKIQKFVRRMIEQSSSDTSASAGKGIFNNILEKSLSSLRPSKNSGD